VRLPDQSMVSFPIDPFSKTCLLNGVDELGYILSFEKEITAYEQKSL
jgi:3-isopropylmalate/(R)-2-methylmalate dehydratase small subunit